MKIKKSLILAFLLSIFITLPTTCNAEEVPTIKWEEDITTGYSNSSRVNSQLYNINNDILIVNNTFSNNYNSNMTLRLYNSSGEKKWKYSQEYVTQNHFLINDKYLAVVEPIWSSNDETKYISSIDLKTGKLSKKIDISKIIDDMWSKANKDYTEFIYTGYYNNKIILLFYDRKLDEYYFYSLDIDGNVEIQKKGKIDIINGPSVINNNNTIYITTDNKIIEFSKDTGNIIKTEYVDFKLDLNHSNITKFKDGILLYGSKNGYMSLEYYDLKNNKYQFKQLEEEGKINSIKVDEKDNLYITGHYIDDNTLGKAYFTKYTYNNSDFQKIYENIYENNELENNVYTFTNSIVFKNNKLAIVGNTLTNYGYYTGKDFLVYYDGTKNYKIDKVIKGSGNLDVVECEEEDNKVKYQIKPAFGYKLISLKIVTETGKEIEISDDSSFIMPNENITITATFEPIIKNPVTSNNILKILLELIISISIVYLITKSIRKRKFDN